MVKLLQKFKKLHLRDYLLVVISLYLILLTLVRSYNFSFTHDESFTFLHHVQLSVKDIFLYNGLAPANNHLLNTLLIKFFSSLFGSSEIVLRLPSILGHITYLAASFFFVRKFKNTFIFLSSFLILNVNPFILDYFVLARGYGLGLAFLLMGVFFLRRNLTEKEIVKKTTFLTSLFGALSVLANFVFLNFYLSLIGILFLINLCKFFRLKKKENSTIKSLFLINLPLIINTLVLTMIIFYPIYKLRRENMLYYGGENGFWEDTVLSLVKATIYGRAYPEYITDIFPISILITIILGTILSIYLLMKYKAKIRKLGLVLFFLLLIITSLSTVLQNKLFGTRFLIDRTAILFIPLFSLVVIYIFVTLAKAKKFKIFSVAIMGILTLLYTYHFIFSSNFLYTQDFIEEIGTKKVIQDLSEEFEEIQEEKITLATDWYRGPSIDYYKKIKNLTWLDFDIHGLEKEDNSSFDFYYCSQSDRKKISALELEEREYFQESNYYLLGNTSK